MSTIEECEALKVLRYTNHVAKFDDLAEDNTHLIAIVLFRFSEGPAGEPVGNNYIVTAYQKEIG